MIQTIESNSNVDPAVEMWDQIPGIAEALMKAAEVTKEKVLAVAGTIGAPVLREIQLAS